MGCRTFFLPHFVHGLPITVEIPIPLCTGKINFILQLKCLVLFYFDLTSLLQIHKFDETKQKMYIQFLIDLRTCLVHLYTLLTWLYFLENSLKLHVGFQG